jgi:hypothetical protein
MTQTLKEVIDECAKKLVESKDYTGDPKKDAEKVSVVVYEAVQMALNQYNVKSAIQNERTQ